MWLGLLCEWLKTKLIPIPTYVLPSTPVTQNYCPSQGWTLTFSSLCEWVILRFYPKVYARWTVIIGGGKSPIKWAKKPPTTRKSTAKLSHIAKVQGRLEPTLCQWWETESFKRGVLSSRPQVAPYVVACNLGILSFEVYRKSQHATYLRPTCDLPLT